jgi:hypothetical protein
MVPLDLGAVGADDELLDVLAVGFSGRPPLGQGPNTADGSGDRGDQRMLALLGSLRAEVDSEPFPELVSVDAACRAVAAGHRSVGLRGRLMPVVAAAGVVVLGLSGLGIAARNAEPGDSLWGVSRVLEPSRATSVQAAYQVDLALIGAERALAQGRVSQAQQMITAVAPQLSQVRDPERKDELARKSANLLNTAAQTPQGQPVQTDEQGVVRDRGQQREPGQGKPRNPGGGDGPNEPGSQPSTAGTGAAPGTDPNQQHENQQDHHQHDQQDQGTQDHHQQDQRQQDHHQQDHHQQDQRQQDHHQQDQRQQDQRQQDQRQQDQRQQDHHQQDQGGKRDH